MAPAAKHLFLIVIPSEDRVHQPRSESRDLLLVTAVRVAFSPELPSFTPAANQGRSPSTPCFHCMGRQRKTPRRRTASVRSGPGSASSQTSGACPGHPKFAGSGSPGPPAPIRRRQETGGFGSTKQTATSVCAVPGGGRNDENDKPSNGHSPALYGTRHSRHEQGVQPGKL